MLSNTNTIVHERATVAEGGNMIFNPNVIVEKLIEGKGNVSPFTGKVSLTEDDLSLIETEEWAADHPIKGEWRCIHRYTKNRNITWKELAKLIRERNTKEHTELIAAVNKSHSNYRSTMSAAETRLHDSIVDLSKVLNKDAIKAVLAEAGIRLDIPELD
jgi:hypothetical protein